MHLNSRHSHLQQNQFMHLLDTVPDAVMISQQTESHALTEDKVVYANRTMKDFFGSDPT